MILHPFRADLHLHSIYSDGSYCPEELFALAAQKGLQAISITDHDTVEAYPEAFKYVEKTKIQLVSGVEFSCLFEGISVHVLGYHFAWDAAPIRQLCLRHTEWRQKRNRAILERLKQLNIPIEESELKGYQIGRPHIAHVLLQKGVVRSIKEAFNRYLAEGKRAYVQGDSCSVEETIGVIRAAGGKAFLAHPHLLPKRKVWLRRLLALPFDGIECYYSKFPLDQKKKWLDLAKEKGLLVSGGSDFHGEYKPFDEMGSSWIDEEGYNKIIT